MVNTNAMLYGMMAGQQVGQYHLESLLGAGGFGGVFRANEVVRDRVLRQVAVKVIPGSDEQQLEELLAAANLEHDHLVRCYAAGECSLLNIEALYLAMELASEGLDSHLQGKRLETEEIQQIIGDVAAGLAYLHSQNQVHRDLKPANVLRVKGQWKLSDFGLVRHLGTNSYAQTANPIGTIAYMPPEAFEGNISAAWDMWSLGIMLVQMATNRLPYQFNEPTQLLKRVMNCELNLPTLPEEFKPIILGCLQQDRQRRWTANQVLSALQPSSPPPPPVLILNLPNNVKLEMLKIPAGSFLMGSADNDPSAYDSEKPQHRVTLQEYYLGKYPITQEQYQAVMGRNPSHFKDNPKNPVETVSWNDAKAFCQKVYEKTGQKVRLPTEAEWEYGCRAGTTTRYYFGDNENQLGEYAWHYNNSGSQTRPVGQKKPNGWGLYDMHGNVWEWCEDKWHENYQGAPTDGSAWIQGDDGEYALRGGSWLNNSWYCRSSFRGWNDPDYGDNYNGFRVVVSP